jgi:hypothetical protein
VAQNLAAIVLFIILSLSATNKDKTVPVPSVHGLLNCRTPFCVVRKDPKPTLDLDVALVVLKENRVSLVGEWSEEQVIELGTGVNDLSRAVGGREKLIRLFGGHANLVSLSRPFCYGGIACAPPPPLSDGHSAYFNKEDSITHYDVVHELAHVIDWQNQWAFSRAGVAETTEYSRCVLCLPGVERWAEGVAVWVYAK